MAEKILNHLSHSQVQEFTTCPRRYHLHRRLGLKAAFCPSGLLFGSAIHEALSLYHQMRLEGKEATLSQMTHVLNDCLESEALPIRFRPGESTRSLKTLARKMLQAYLESDPTLGRVLAVEEAFEISFAPELPPIQGIIDLVEKTEDGSLLLTDFKTSSSRRRPEPEQLILYHQALRALDYPGNGRVTTRYVVLLKTNSVDVTTFEVQVSDGDTDRLRSLYESVWRDIRLGCSFPKTGWWCAGCQWQKYCDQA